MIDRDAADVEIALWELLRRLVPARRQPDYWLLRRAIDTIATERRSSEFARGIAVGTKLEQQANAGPADDSITHSLSRPQ